MRLAASKTGWELYQFPPSFVLGFHGCDKSVGEAVLSGKIAHLKPSDNPYDWLGTGIYFWESNPLRALEFAQERAGGAKNSKGTIKEPFVVGAIINLGYCLDTRDSLALAEIKEFYELLRESLGPENLPKNGASLKVRNLDCAVFNFLHESREAAQPPLRPYDTVRATYREGSALYPGTDLCQQDHTQICVRNTSSILGYFRPLST